MAAEDYHYIGRPVVAPLHRTRRYQTPLIPFLLQHYAPPILSRRAPPTRKKRGTSSHTANRRLNSTHRLFTPTQHSFQAPLSFPPPHYWLCCCSTLFEMEILTIATKRFCATSFAGVLHFVCFLPYACALLLLLYQGGRLDSCVDLVRSTPLSLSSLSLSVARHRRPDVTQVQLFLPLLLLFSTS